MRKINFTRVLIFSLHSWLGLISGIFLLLLGLSGSAGQPWPLDTIYRSIGQQHPNLTGIAWLNPNATTEEAYEFRLYQNDGKISTYDLGMMSIDPYSGKR
ncbi:hypothetical protein [Pedobacter sp. FW305-3-2-15-E-R2A2]|uniref:hypothetical protein n=1 Tax=Pedobacter sp. FW305-3-2-15-E-R2A2 TaxID=3140251 RepID=UPI00313FE119